MRQQPTGDPPPRGIGGTSGHIQECLRNAGIGGAAAGPDSINPIAGMALYGASLANLSRQGGSNVGAQNRAPMRLTTPPGVVMAAPPFASSAAAAAAILAAQVCCSCDALDAAGGSGIGGTGPGANHAGMSTCDLNAAYCIGPCPVPDPGPPPDCEPDTCPSTCMAPPAGPPPGAGPGGPGGPGPGGPGGGPPPP